MDHSYVDSSRISSQYFFAFYTARSRLSKRVSYFSNLHLGVLTVSQGVIDTVTTTLELAGPSSSYVQRENRAREPALKSLFLKLWVSIQWSVHDRTGTTYDEDEAVVGESHESV